MAPSAPQDPGAWTLGSGSGFTSAGSGFTLKNGKGSKKGQIFLSDFHLKVSPQPECEVAPNAIVKVPASFAFGSCALEFNGGAPK